MFIKIKDNNQYNARHQFIRTFGFDCLQKIKKIQSSLKQINWEVSVCPFQSIVGRVKTVIESYQLIAHQIFDSCQSVKYDALGQAILKMFLQLSSTIKWLIKSFMTNNGKRALPTQQIIQQKKQQTQTQKFRNRQISRFVLKGVMQQFNSQQNSTNQNLDQSNQYLSENKENYKKSKSKVLSTNASNLPLILQDAIQTLKKKSDYIEKFVALRENYDNTYRYEQPMTSQAILQSELGIKDNVASQKFKQIFNRIVNLNIIRKVNKNQLGVQTDSENNNIHTDKNKKTLQKNKIKLMTQQLQKQKKVNKQLKIQLQIYEKRLTDSLKQNQQYEYFKKRMSMVPRYQKRIEKNYTKPQSQQKIDIQKLKSKLKQDDNIPKQKQQKVQQNKMPQSVQSNNGMQQEVKVVQQELNKRSLLLKKKSSMNLINRFNKQISIKGNSSFNKSFLFQITPQVFNLNYFKQKDFIKQNKQSKILWLKLESVVFNIIIDNLGLKKEQNEQKLVNQQKLLSIGHLPANINQQSIINNKNGINKLNRTHQTSTFKKLKDKSETKIQIKGEQKNLDRQNIQQKKIASLIKQNQQFFQFQKYFKRKQLLKIEIPLDTLHQFFIEQNTAKNYELLNLSQICNHHRKLKLHPNKKQKLSVQVNSLFLSSSQGSRQIKTAGSQNQNTFSSVIVKQIFNQIIRIKKLNKETYLKIILFLRYPYSSVHRSEELYDKLDEFEQQLVRLQEINSHIKRIWSMHSKCEIQKNFRIPYLWCKHKYFIINFFGFYQNLQIGQREL